MDREQMENAILWAASSCTTKPDGSWEADEGVLVRPDGRAAIVVDREGRTNRARTPRELHELVRQALPRKNDGECKAMA